MKKIKWFAILIVVVTLFSTDDVNAATDVAKLAYQEYQMECIYDSGIKMVITGSTVDNNNYFNIKMSSSAVQNGITLPFANDYKFVYKEQDIARSAMKNFTCPSSFVVANFYHVNNLDGNKKQKAYYEIYLETNTYKNVFKVNYNKEFTGCNVSEIACQGAEGKLLAEKFDSWKWAMTCDKITGLDKDICYPFVAGFEKYTISSSSLLNNRKIVLNNSPIHGEDVGFEIRLVSERVKFKNAPETQEWNFKNLVDQAVNKNHYIKIMKYQSPSEVTKYFLSKDGEVTPVGDYLNYYDEDGVSVRASDRNTKFLCARPVVTKMSQDPSNPGAEYSGVRHSINGQAIALVKLTDKDTNEVLVNRPGLDKRGFNFDERKCNGDYTLYQEVASSEVPEEIQPGTSICEVLPNTAVWLVFVINLSQIFVPAILIILTGIDITKIVLAGNIDEELPKKRKLIIIRFIVAIAYFFIPIFIRVIVNSSYGVDFGDVGCLFDGTVKAPGSIEEMPK